MSYKISVQAAEDIEHIWFYTLENWSLEQADRYINLVLDEVEYLATHPNAGKDCSHIRKSYSSSKVKSHVIFYKVIDNTTHIEIIRVLHQKMDIKNRLNE